MHDPSSLTPKQQRFADQYLIDLNGTQAYIRAGYRVRSDAVAAVNAVRLLGNAKVAAAIVERRARLSEKLEITQERVLHGYARIAFGDSRSVLSWGPDGVRLRDSDDRTDYQTVPFAKPSCSLVFIYNKKALTPSGSFEADWIRAVIPMG